MTTPRIDSASPTVRPPAAPAAGQVAPVAAGPSLASDQFVKTGRAPATSPDPGMGDDPQELYGVKLSAPMLPYQKDLDRFVADSTSRIDKLADQLRQDPAFQRVSAPGIWEKLSPRERLAFADHVSRLQGQLLGFKPARAHLDRDSDPKDDGGFDDDTGRLDINRNSDTLNHLGAFLNTVVHEQFHCYQHYLERHQFPAGDPRRAAAQVYRLNEKVYHDAPDDANREPAKYAAYRSQPSEAHAFMMGQRLYQRLFGRGN